MKISLRTACIKDLRILTHWDEQEHVIASDPDDDWQWEYELQRFPEWREQLIAEADGRSIGCVQIIDPLKEESHYWGDVSPGLRAIDIWIGEASDLGVGYGTKIMTLAIERCFNAKEVTAIVIDPLMTNLRAIKFYERMGFEFIENRRFEDSDCAVYQLTRKKWEDHQT